MPVVSCIESPLWEIIPKFYQSLGIEAWQGKVPYRVTSSCFLAQNFAQCIQNSAIQEPFDVFELGAGHGQFSFLLQKHLPKNAAINLFMTDGAQANVDFFHHHPQIQSSQLSTQRYDVSEAILHQQKPERPCFFIANYIFDSLPFIPIHHSQDDLLLYDLDATFPYQSLSKNTKNLDQIQWSFHPRKIKQNELKPRILETVHSLPYGLTTIPIQTIEWIEMLSECQHPVIIIGTDKGVIDRSTHYYDEHFSLILDGCFSSTVNLEFIKKHIELHHMGHCFLKEQSPSNTNLKNFIIALNTTLPPELIGDAFDAHDFYSIQDMGASASSKSRHWSALLRLSHFDPWMFDTLYPKLMHHLSKTPQEHLYYQKILTSVLNNLFVLPGMHTALRLADALNQCRAPHLAHRALMLYKNIHGEDVLYLREYGRTLLKENRITEAHSAWSKALSKKVNCPIIQNLLKSTTNY